VPRIYTKLHRGR